MRVLFLAYGATRRRAAIEESAQVVADGGRAVVLVDEANVWTVRAFAPGVELREVSSLREWHRPPALGMTVLYKGPRFLFDRVAGWGRLRRWSRRLATFYERGVADRVYRMLLAPFHDRSWDRARPRLIAERAFAGAAIDVLVVHDPRSMPEAARILASYRDGRPPPRLAYSVDHIGASAR